MPPSNPAKANGEPIKYQRWIWSAYEGIDPKKWPNTFNTLLLMTFLPGWHTEGKWVAGCYRDFRNPGEMPVGVTYREAYNEWYE